MKRKLRNIALLSLTLLAAGCVVIPSPYSEQLQALTTRYYSIANGVSLLEIEKQLGSPNREEADGARVWETRFDELNYAMIRVWFSAGKARKIEMTRAHGTSFPGYRAAAATTQTQGA